MLVGRAGLESPLALEGVAEGELGEALAYVSSFTADCSGVAVPMFNGFRPVMAPEGEGEGLGLVGEDGGASDVGDFGGPPPHWDMNERTVGRQPARPFTNHARQAQRKGLRFQDPVNIPRERGMIARGATLQSLTGLKHFSRPRPGLPRNLRACCSDGFETASLFAWMRCIYKEISARGP